MVSVFKKKLDKLMGKNRNIPFSEQKNDEHYYDEDVCKHFLCTICPHELFPNTKYDLGPCPKRHDDFFKIQFIKKKTLEKFKDEKNYIKDALSKNKKGY